LCNSDTIRTFENPVKVAQGQVMNCKICGSLISNEMSFCGHCGNKIEIKIEKTIPEASDVQNSPEDPKYMLLKIVLVVGVIWLIFWLILGGGTSEKVEAASEHVSPSSSLASANALSYIDSLHTMSQQDLERELSVADKAFNDTLVANPSCYSKDTSVQKPSDEVCARTNNEFQQAKSRFDQVGSELRARRGVAEAQANKSQTQPADWKVISQSDDSTTYVDMNSITDMGSSIKRIRLVINFKQRLGQEMSDMTINEFDCGNKAVRYVKGEGFTEIYGQGTLLGTTYPESFGTVAGVFTPVRQDETMMLQQYDLACSK
jgi:hypothetical protein